VVTGKALEREKFISILALVWAIFAVGCGLLALSRTPPASLLLGVAESGLSATVILLSHWFSRSERARANAFWCCVCRSGHTRSPFSGWILDHWNWRVMLVARFSAIFLAGNLLYVIQDHPAEAPWLPEVNEAL